MERRVSESIIIGFSGGFVVESPTCWSRCRSCPLVSSALAASSAVLICSMSAAQTERIHTIHTEIHVYLSAAADICQYF